MTKRTFATRGRLTGVSLPALPLKKRQILPATQKAPCSNSPHFVAELRAAAFHGAEGVGLCLGAGQAVPLCLGGSAAAVEGLQVGVHGVGGHALGNGVAPLVLAKGQRRGKRTHQHHVG